MGRNGTTVREVAHHAGVSIATVSRVVRGVGQIAPETRQRVLASIAELGYRPSHLGRALVERRHAALGIVLPSLSGPYFSEVIEGFEVEALAARVSVLILGTHILRESDEVVLEMAGRVDGMAILGGTLTDETIHKLVALAAPTVLLAGAPIAGLPDVPAVRVENYRSTIDLTRHLIERHGYERLAFLGDPTGSPDVSARWRGFVDGHRQAGVEPPQEPVRVGHNQPDGLVAAAHLLDTAPPRAIVCANDEIALGVYGAAAARGIVIPDQLAVTGWDDIAMARLVSPGLSTVRQPMRALGSRAAQVLLAQIQGDQDVPSDSLLPTEVVIRASCGCRWSEERRS